MANSDDREQQSLERLLETVQWFPSYSSSRAGSVGELAAAWFISAAGYNVAKPYWNDDEIDLVIIEKRRASLAITIPVQVKTLQFPSGTDTRKLRAYESDM